MVDWTSQNIVKKRCTYRRGWVFVLNFEEIHRSDHALHGHKDVLKDQLNEAAFVFFRIPCSMNNPHLFYKCRLPRFSRAWNISQWLKYLEFRNPKKTLLMPYLYGATWKFKMKSYLHDKGIKGQSIVNQKIYIKYIKFCKLSSDSAYRYKIYIICTFSHQIPIPDHSSFIAIMKIRQRLLSK